MKVPAKSLIYDAAETCAWSDDTMIQVLCQFIDQLNTPTAETDFMTFIDNKVDDELLFGNDGQLATCLCKMTSVRTLNVNLRRLPKV